MYTVIIADDEELECRGQEKILRDSFANIRLLPSVYNGEELIASVKKNKPDIIITDINMPGMNGLKAIGQLRKNSVHSKVIINTAYSEFEYAKEAITLGACDFLVKPLEKEVYLQAMIKAMEAADRERSWEKASAVRGDSFRKIADIAGRELISSIILGKPNEEELTIWLENMGHTYWGGVFLAASVENPDKLVQLEQTADRLLAGECTFLSKIHENMLVLFLFPGGLINRENDKKWIETWLLQLDQNFQTVCGQKVRFGVSRWRYDYEEMVLAYQEAVTALRENADRICFFETEERSFRNHRPDDRLTERLADEIREKRIIRAESLLEEQLLLCQQMRSKKQYVHIILIEQLQECSRKICRHNIYSWQQLCQTFSSLCGPAETARAAGEYLQVLIELETHEASGLNYVWDALNYIETYYAKDISLEETAAASGQGISSFYLSRLLTQRLKTSFTELLTSARINQAINLIRMADSKTTRLGERVGYQSAAYFYKVFKKNTGLTVGEMREFLTGK